MNDELKKDEKKDEKKRLGVAELEITVTYEDGFSNTTKSPKLLVWKPAQVAVVTPNPREVPMAKNVHIEGIRKMITLVDQVKEDLLATIPTEEEIAKAREELAAQAAEMQRQALMQAQMPQKPSQ
jgi:hypothetical protein